MRNTRTLLAIAVIMAVCTPNAAVSLDQTRLKTTVAQCEAMIRDTLDKLELATISLHEFKTKYPNDKHQISLKEKNLRKWKGFAAQLFSKFFELNIVLANLIRTNQEVRDLVDEKYLFHQMGCQIPKTRRGR